MTETEVIDVIESNPPKIDEPDKDDNDNGGNSGFDIFKFIRNQLNNPAYFKKLFVEYTEKLPETHWLYLSLYVPCFLLDIIYYVILHFLMLLTLIILVYGLAKVFGFDQFLLELCR